MFYLVFGELVPFITVIANFAIHMTVLNHFKHQHDKFSLASRELLNFTLFSATLLSFLHFIFTVIANFVDNAKYVFDHFEQF